MRLQDCPYCGSPCDADWVDVGVGHVQCGPYHCENCHAYEIGPEWEEVEHRLSEEEKETGWYKPAEQKQITCIHCKKRPEEINEYIEAAKVEEMTPTQYVIENEGTYNAFLKNQFYCSSCYIEVGMPIRG